MGKSKAVRKENMVIISFHLPRSYVIGIDTLVAQGHFPSRSEAIRYAITKLIMQVRQGQQQGQQQQGQEQQVGDPDPLPMAPTRVRWVETEGGGGDYEDVVVLRCGVCGYEMLVLTDRYLTDLIRTLKTHRAVCPRCGSHELVLEFTERKKQQETAPEVTQA